MIARSEPHFVIEGHAYRDGDFVPTRIEIDRKTGCIATLGTPQGKGDLLLGEDQLILPGCIDFHVHAREDASGEHEYKENFQSAGEAAVHGGVTAIVDMPNNPSPPVDEESYARKRELAARSPVEVLLYAGIGQGTRPLSFPVPYKAYMGPSVGQLFFDDDESLRDALAHYRGQWVSFHAESPEILRQCKSRPTHHERRPPEAEIEAVRLALSLARDFSIHPHICHLSTAGGFEEIVRMRERGFPVTCEVTPHHLMFDLEGLPSLKRASFFQCNPPIRSRSDRLTLLDAFRRGEIDFLATDHAPHSLDENERGVSGIPHLDTFAPFLFWLREQGVEWTEICAAAAERPGRAFGRFTSTLHGRIDAGFAASFTVLDRRRPITIRRQSLRTRARWSPFEGMTFSGSVAYTVVRGKVFKAPSE